MKNISEYNRLFFQELMVFPNSGIHAEILQLSLNLMGFDWLIG